MGMKRPLYTPEEVAQAVDRYTARTIPVHASVQGKQVVLSEPEMEALLAGAQLIALGNCDCRQKQGQCDAPLEVCISLNGWAQEMIMRGNSRPVSLPEALDALRRSHQVGLVHLAYRQGEEEVGQVCSCCSCCCWFLNVLKCFDYHDAIAESAFIAAFEPALCNGCGVCLGRCQFGAWERRNPFSGRKRVSSGVHFNPARCFGCGLCVSACPTGAVSLVERARS